MLLSFAAILAGLLLLVWGADRFITGAAALARNLGVAPLLIGLTVVGIGTSAPEILVSTMAAWQGNPGLAIGNAIGSNIANIGLILGVTAMIAPLAVHSGILRREYPLLLGVSLVVWWLLADHYLGRLDGLILVVGLIAATLALIHIGRSRGASDPLPAEFDAEIRSDLSIRAALGWFGLGLGVLLAGSRLLVWGAVEVAQAFGVSDLVIGLTIVAIGTSLPELAASIASALKREHDIAIGNVIGSNLYNLLAVLCVPGLLSPGPVAGAVVTRDLPVMMLLTVALYLLGGGLGNHHHIRRGEGLLLTLAFVAYQAWLFTDGAAIGAGT